MAAPDLEGVWDALISYLGSCAELAALRARSPNALQVKKGQPERNDQSPLQVVVDLGAWVPVEGERSAGNEVQHWDYAFKLYISAAGPDMATNDSLCLSVCSALIDAFLANPAGKSLGTDGSLVHDTRLGQGSWDPDNDDDTISAAVQDLFAKTVSQ